MTVPKTTTRMNKILQANKKYFVRCFLFAKGLLRRKEIL